MNKQKKFSLLVGDHELLILTAPWRMRRSKLKRLGAKIIREAHAVHDEARRRGSSIEGNW